MMDWKSQFDSKQPCWDGYRGLLAALQADSFPGTAALNGLLPPGTRSGGGAAVQFVPASRLPGVAYERHIFETGEVSTRENSWHDLFNALAWCRLPCLKASMNSLHYQHLDISKQGRRGKMRDALTLFDESGVIVYGSNRGALEALARRDWNAAFVDHNAAWAEELQVLVCGHAILEKFLNPYKAMTGHVLFLHTASGATTKDLDTQLAQALNEGRLFDSTAGLSPLPLMGIPAWWSGREQDLSFYGDQGVFRPAPAGMIAATVHRI